MAIYKVQLDSGDVVEFEADEGLNEAEAIATANDLYAQDRKSKEIEATTPVETPKGKSAQQKIAEKTLVPAVDLALTLGTGAVGQAVGGIAGLVASPFVGLDKSVEIVKGVSDALTWSPKSVALNRGLAAAAPYVERADLFVKDSASSLSGGNPELATALETGLNALLMTTSGGAIKAGTRGAVSAAQAAKAGGRGNLVAAGKGTAAGVREFFKESPLVKLDREWAKPNKDRQKLIEQTVADLQNEAANLGIVLDRRKIHDTVTKAAEKFTADQSRGANLEIVQKELVAREAAAHKAADDAFDAFRKLDHFSDVTWVDKSLPLIAKELGEKGYRLDSPLVQKAFEDIAGLRTRMVTKPGKDLLPRTAPNNLKISRTSLNEIQAIRSRLLQLGRDAQGTADGAAIGIIGKRLDEGLEQQFLADAAKGIDAPWEAWRGARELWSKYKKDWNENEAVAKILQEKNMDPEKLARVILGTSSMLGGREAGKIYTNIMKLVDHNPDVAVAIHSAVGFDLMKPLLSDFPPTAASFRQVANNVGKLLKENRSLVDAMGMDPTMLRSLQHGARVAQFTEFKTPSTIMDWITQGITRFAVGHEIAQAGFKVKLGQKFADWVVGKDRTSHREMLKEFSGATDVPLSDLIAKKTLAEIMIKGEIASQLSDLGGDWEHEY